MIRYFLIALPFAWLAGVVVYLLTIWIGWQQRVSFNDLRAVAINSGIGVALAALFLYVPAFTLLKKMLHGVRPRGWFVFVGAIAAPIISAGIVYAWDGSLRGFFSVDQIPFNLQFAVTGGLLGWAYAWRDE